MCAAMQHTFTAARGIYTLIAFTHYRTGKYRFGIFKRKREKKIMVMLMLPKEQWV